MSPDNAKPRILIVDILKGIAIMIVVSQHSWLNVHRPGEWDVMGSLLGLPIFFFTAGIFFKPHVGFWQLIVHKADAILKPYFVTLLILLPYQVLLLKEALPKVLSGIGYSHSDTIIWSPMWFLPYLFVVIVTAWLWLRVSGLGSVSRPDSTPGLDNVWGQHQPSKRYQVLTVIGLFGLGYLSVEVIWPWAMAYLPALAWYDEPVERIGLPFSLDATLMGLPFFMCGFLLRNWITQFSFSKLGFAVSASVFFGLNYMFDDVYSVMGRRYDNPLTCTLTALAGICLSLYIAWLISKNKVLERIFTYVGRNSLFILIFHFYLQRKIYDALLVQLDMSLYAKDVIAFAASIAGSLLIAEIIRSNRYTAVLWLPWKAVKPRFHSDTQPLPMPHARLRH